MAVKIIVGIDGTGSAVTPGASRDRQYDIDFKDSFVTKIARRAGPNKGYWRGPVALGGGLVPAINGAFSFIQQRVNSTRGMKHVLLTGYSRGAAGVVSLAKKLEGASIDVEAMLLFDCVDRHMFIDAEIIPRNVKNVLHLIRDPKSSSRESFGNDGMRYYPPTKIECYKFMCTHGGLGGCPWKVPAGGNPNQKINEGGYDGATNITYAQDKKKSQEIWQFIQPFCQKYGFL